MTQILSDPNLIHSFVTVDSMQFVAHVRHCDRHSFPGQPPLVVELAATDFPPHPRKFFPISVNFPKLSEISHNC